MDIYAIVTEKIINLLEQGIVPWRRPWTSTGLPRNLVSKKPYRGVNHFLLSASKYVSPFWLTMRQANELGGHVRKGEESTIVVFWKVDDAKQTHGRHRQRAAEREIAPAISIAILSRFQSGTMRAPASRARQTPEDRNARARSDRSSRADQSPQCRTRPRFSTQDRRLSTARMTDRVTMPPRKSVRIERRRILAPRFCTRLTHYADFRIMPRIPALSF